MWWFKQCQLFPEEFGCVRREYVVSLGEITGGSCRTYSLFLSRLTLISKPGTRRVRLIIGIDTNMKRYLDMYQNCLHVLHSFGQNWYAVRSR